MNCPYCDAEVKKRDCAQCSYQEDYCSGCGNWGSGHFHAPSNDNVRVVG